MKRIFITAALVASFHSAPTLANIKGDVCVFVNGTVGYNCATLGTLKLQQIYEKGWRVVTSYVLPGQSTVFLIIEEQKP